MAYSESMSLPPSPTMNAKPPVIALVENDVAANRAFTRLLMAYGYAVETHLSADSFLERPSMAQPDCLLLDIDLDGRSGLDLLQVLRQRDINTPAVFLTGRTDDAARSRAEALGCCAFLNKPVQGQHLVSAIQNAVESLGSN
jgi:FixJ family two-component response regulator